MIHVVPTPRTENRLVENKRIMLYIIIINITFPKRLIVQILLSFEMVLSTLIIAFLGMKFLLSLSQGRYYFNNIVKTVFNSK